MRYALSIVVGVVVWWLCLLLHDWLYREFEDVSEDDVWHSHRKR